MRLSAPNFSLQHTLESGQLFRYEKVPEGYLVSHRDKVFVISQEGDELVVHHATRNVTSEWLKHFFALDELPPKPVDSFTREALEHCGGLRVCRQDPWECTIGFICSQNNSVPRIRQLMTGLARAFGTPVAVGPYTGYLFAEPGQISAGIKLAALKAGYREEYIVLASEVLSDEWLESLAELSYDSARHWLLKMRGIGPKVADCILLFAYRHKNAFPVDTWVEQIMREDYNIQNKKDMHVAARRVFGEEAGIMQQYLFHYKRNRT